MTIKLSKTLMLGLCLSGLSGLSGLVGCQAAWAGFAKGDSVTMGGQAVFQMASADGYSGEHRA